MSSPRGFVLTGCCLLALLSAGCINVSGSGSVGWPVYRDEKRFSIEGKPDLGRSAFDGSIQIRSWDRPDTLFVVENGAPNESDAGAIHVQSGQDGYRCTAQVKPDSS